MFPGILTVQHRGGLQLQDLKEKERREYLVGRTQIILLLSVVIPDAVSLGGPTRKPVQYWKTLFQAMCLSSLTVVALSGLYLRVPVSRIISNTGAARVSVQVGTWKSWSLNLTGGAEQGIQGRNRHFCLLHCSLYQLHWAATENRYCFVNTAYYCCQSEIFFEFLVSKMLVQSETKF